jgi:putative oxidoreductase
MNNDRALFPDRYSLHVALLFVRVIVGTIFVAHGAQLLFGAWGGPGIQKAIPMLGVGPLGYLVVLGQFFGGLLLILGLLSRFSAAALIVIMIGAIVKVHWPNGFFLSYVDPMKNGFEYNLALIGLLLPVFLCGPGLYSLAQVFLPKSSRTGRPVVVLE